MRQVFLASGYLARLTLHCVGDIFVGARRTMDWLTSSAKIVAGARAHPHRKGPCLPAPHAPVRSNLSTPPRPAARHYACRCSPVSEKTPHADADEALSWPEMGSVGSVSRVSCTGVSWCVLALCA